MYIKPIFEPDGSVDQSNYYTFINGFNEQELEWIDNLKECYDFETATTVGDVDNVRKSKVKWMHIDERSHWVYDKIKNFVMEANEIWKFDLKSIIDSIQYTEYYDDGGHYGWHMDIGPGSINHRKISVTVQLSDPSEYDGGDFELWTGSGIQTLPKIKGSVLLFPSFMIHRVTPVTRGVRRSLVLWVGGSSYK